MNCQANSKPPNDCRNAAASMSGRVRWSTCINCTRCPDEWRSEFAQAAQETYRFFASQANRVQLATFEDLRK